MGSHLHGHGHLKVLPHHGDGIQTSEISVFTSRAGVVDFEEAKGLEPFIPIIETCQDVSGCLPYLFHFDCLACFHEEFLVM